MGPLSKLHQKARTLFGLPTTPASPTVSQPGQPAIRATSPASSSALATPVDDTIRLRQPRRDEIPGAIRLMLSGAGRVVDDEAVADFLKHAAPPRVDFSQLLVAERRGRLLWAVLPVVSPGRTALLLGGAAPHATSDHAAAAALIDTTCDNLRQRGVHLAQALIEPSDQRSLALYQAHRFAPLAELIYLAANPRKKQVPPAIPDGTLWVPYEPGPVHELFKQTIGKSYEKSLDCPALNGLRDLEDVVAGHRASGEFSPKLWRLLCLPPAIAGGQPDPLGVLLLSRVPASQSVELVYLGLVPDARRRKLGDLLVRHALAAVAVEGMQRLSLAVDAKNSPALTIYYRNGLSKVGSKLALLRDLRVPPDRLTLPEPTTENPVPDDTQLDQARPLECNSENTISRYDGLDSSR